MRLDAKRKPSNIMGRWPIFDGETRYDDTLAVFGGI